MVIHCLVGHHVFLYYHNLLIVWEWCKGKPLVVSTCQLNWSKCSDFGTGGVTAACYQTPFDSVCQ